MFQNSGLGSDLPTVAAVEMRGFATHTIAPVHCESYKEKSSFQMTSLLRQYKNVNCIQIHVRIILVSNS